MPLLPGNNPKVLSQNFNEFRHGPTFAHTAKKFGSKKAHAQMIAAILSNVSKNPKPQMMNLGGTGE